MLADCAKMGEDAGYQEINLNVGCPSHRVKSGNFGACLMLNPVLVAECVQEMASSIRIPVTVKCRIGVDHNDSYFFLSNFIHDIHQAGCDTFIIHARKAWLNGLSPKQNREIPPLQYEVVQQIKKDFPYLTIIINGGIKKLVDIHDQLKSVDGVMIGREAYANPYLLTEIEKNYFQQSYVPSRFEIIEQFLPYVEEQLKNQIQLSSITRHMLGIFQGEKGGKAWRRMLSGKKSNQIDTIIEALNHVKMLQ
jgi:tRNA-dihydrouridine synthase A